MPLTFRISLFLLAAAGWPGAALAQPDAKSASTSEMQLHSTVPGLVLAPLANLPRAPATAARRQGCEHLLAQPASTAARQVAAAGWAVTGEVQLGRYQAVSFVGRMEQSTSGTCALSQGNVALYEGGQLRALAYAAPGASLTLGRIRPLEGVGLRIWDGDLVPSPIADLRLNGDDGLSILPIAAEERRCQGQAVIPNIYGKPIDVARQALMAAGWRPVPSQRLPAGSREAELSARGMVEVDSCAGTGMGFCLFNYTGAAGRLSVTTVGDADPPVVSGYGVDCAGGPAGGTSGGG
jgi:hypothetical protein